MEIKIRNYNENDIEEMMKIWNEVVTEGNAFPQIEPLDFEEAVKFFEGQSCCGVCEDTDSKKLLGLYILHPNNVGRCGHISNASYAVKSEFRGLHIGEKLVLDSIERAGEKGFKILQFNAVVKSNVSAHKLYKKLGFKALGVIPKGFLNRKNEYEDIVVYYYEIENGK